MPQKTHTKILATIGPSSASKEQIEKLIDAGCDDRQINEFVKLNADGMVNAQINFLKEQRRHLLECLHFRQNQIDCLDSEVFC